MRYLPHTPEEIRQMLDAIGVDSFDALFDAVPPSARFGKRLNIPEGLDEPTLMQNLQSLAAQNEGAKLTSFLGAGIYAHHIPPAVDQLLLRSEFYTSYTPYQPEVAQGTLQAIWEFQTIVSELFGLPLANASMYDGSTACAEAVQMARRLTRRNSIVVSACVHPQYREVIRTTLGVGTKDAPKVIEVPTDAQGRTDVDALAAVLDATTAVCVVGYPTFQGGIIDLAPLADKVHKAGALLTSSTTEPYALALAKAPGSVGVDIATGEGQALACPPNFGGPGVGLFACRNERQFLQQLPGRICGETVDKNGQRGFVLTLSTREQHIRRERATSNICTNQGLLALSLAIRVSMLGKRGFTETARNCLSLAHYAQQKICSLRGYELASSNTFFNEFAIKVTRAPVAQVLEVAQRHGILPGLALGTLDPKQADRLLIAVTEKHTRADLDRLCTALDNA
ncbi:MAG TPA: aminomethyl-transferring glycine dehydrogenase subunit GcvPA [Polyangiaceae bacterium]|jgi:glycine dehydrogenase subunit 1|nr:aminomethyl-transferring glycine dehydrogenase subunit GcvPA [Polyangiaceae bacterium]